mgnify:CR=1 FL=1
MIRQFRIGSLFSGIGGLELGLEAAGLGSTVWQVEQDPYCQVILAKHWPHAKRYEDVCKVSASNLDPVDLVCGGFPCQDLSSAGKRRGLRSSRSGLWFEFFRIVQEISPQVVVVENVTSGESLWLPRVQHDLVSLGYRTEAWRLGAVDVSAPHLRLRTFVVAYTDFKRLQGAKHEQEFSKHINEISADESLVGHPDRQRKFQQEGCLKSFGRRVEDASCSEASCSALYNGDTFCRLGGDAHGFPNGMDLPDRWPNPRDQEQAAWEPKRTAKKGSIPGNQHRLRLLGNAVVPQVARAIGFRVKFLLSDIP